MFARSLLSALGFLAGAALFTTPAAVSAQGGDGFLFKEPRISLSLRAGYDAPMGPRNAGGDTDIFGFTEELLTVGSGDHDALSLGAEFGVRVSDRFDLVLNFDHASSDVRSEFRNWVDLDDLPIQQNTSFLRRSFVVSGRYFLTDRGTKVGSFAWVPRDWAPYVGAGVGTMHYEFTQDGDFVDFETLDIFTDELTSSGSGFMGEVMAGVQRTIDGPWILTGEVRYRWAEADLQSDFVNFDAIDLSGLRATVGFGVRF